MLRPTYFIWYLALWQKIYHVYLAEVEVQAVVLEAGADVIMAATSYAHLAVVIAIWYSITFEQYFFWNMTITSILNFFAALTAMATSLVDSGLMITLG